LIVLVTRFGLYVSSPSFAEVSIFKDTLLDLGGCG